MPPLTLPAVLTPALLSSIRAQPRLPNHTWYFIASVTLSVINRPDEIPKVFNYALEHGVDPLDNAKPSHDEQLKVARKLREGLVKSAAVIGLPKVCIWLAGSLLVKKQLPLEAGEHKLMTLPQNYQTINALFALKTATPLDLQDEPMSLSPSARTIELYDQPSSEILMRGQRFFDKVYGKVSKRVMGQMDRSGTEDLGLTARLMYGYLLSNTSILTPMESSFVLLAGLIPQDVNPQLKGHLKGALNNGATIDEVKAVRDVVIRICEASGMTKLGDKVAQGWGWRGEVANL